MPPLMLAARDPPLGVHTRSSRRRRLVVRSRAPHAHARIIARQGNVMMARDVHAGLRPLAPCAALALC
eukprot:scaffold5920_cov114-Isochrysis_galbana.AAC.6